MAPNLDNDQHQLLQSMISTDRYTALQIATAVKCSVKAVARARSNILHFGSTKAPKNTAGRAQTMTPSILERLCKYLEKHPITLQCELSSIVAENFGLQLSKRRVTAALESIGWSIRVAAQTAEVPNDDLEHSVGASSSGCVLGSSAKRTKRKVQKKASRRQGTELRAWSTQNFGRRYNRRIIAQKALQAQSQS